MDIRKWLAEIDQAVHPEQPAVEPFLLPKQPDSAPHARRRRKRASTDSSLLEAPSPQPRRKGVPAVELDHPNVRDATDRSHSNGSNYMCSESVSDSTTSQRYTRKPRRKIRLDRYEVAMTKRGKEQRANSHSNRKRESRKPKHRSRRKKVEKTHSGIGQEFYAKNVSKDRLTLKPIEKMGLFGKGRTSRSIKGCGLPDLVFSEMKFLQNEHDGHETSSKGPSYKKKPKKDRAQAKEEDISAFFTSARPALADMDSNTQAKAGQQVPTALASKTDCRERMRERSKGSDIPSLTAGSQGKTSHLRLGSRGHLEGASYISGSMSVRTSGVAPGHQGNTCTVQQKQSNFSREDVNNAPSVAEASGWQRATSSEVHKPLTGTARRFRFPSVASLPPGHSRSQSLPQRSSSPQRSNHMDHVLDRRTTADAPSVTSIPPVLRTCCSDEFQKLPGADGPRGLGSIVTSRANDSIVSTDKRAPNDYANKLFCHESPSGSSSLGGVLQHCNDASRVQLHRIAQRQIYNATARSTPEVHDTVGQSRQRSYQSNAHLSAVRFLAPHAQQFSRSNFSGRGIYAQQEQQQHLPVHIDLEEDYPPQNPDTVDQGHACGTGLLDQEELDGFPEDPESSGLMRDFDDDIVGLGYVADNIKPIREPVRKDVVAPSFWRPNKLY